MIIHNGADSRDRTCDKAVNSRLLYQLSYVGKEVETTGLEPVTPCVQSRCSPN